MRTEPRRTAPRRRALVVVAMAGIVAFAGVVVTATSRVHSLDQGARLGGLVLQVAEVGWLDDQMEHPTQFAMPANMMPNLPPHGFQRLKAEITLRNVSRRAQRFAVEELALEAADGRRFGAVVTELPRVELGPEQVVHAVVHFDVGESAGPVELVWLRDGERAVGRVPLAPVHEHEANVPETWPASADALPPGDAERGKRLFVVRYGCASCHGHPLVPGSNSMAPHLGRLPHVAGHRVAGSSPAQYVYDSIVRPQDHRVETCVAGRPCSEFGPMPEFGQAASLQDIADLVAFLLGSGDET